MNIFHGPLPALQAPALERVCKSLSDLLAVPFDAMRSQYAASVRAGLLERSMLQGREVERAIRSLETWALGPFARGM